MNVSWYLQWYNLIFAIPFVLAGVYLVMYSAGGVSLGDADHDADLDADADAGVDADADHDVATDGAEADHDFDAEHDLDADADIDADADHDLDADHDVDADHDIDADHDADAEHDGETPGLPATVSTGTGTSLSAATGVPATSSHPFEGGSGWSFGAALEWLGVGRVPLTILVLVLCMLWGFVGFAVNMLLVGVPLVGPRPWLVSLPLAAIASVMGTKGLGGVLARYMPTTETYVHSRAALTGRSGVAMFGIDHKFGMAFVRDTTGDAHQVACRVYADGQPIAKGQRVLLVDYNSADAFYYVIHSTDT